MIRQNGSLPVKYGLTMDMEAKYSDIKPFLSRLTRIPADNLILVDIVQSQFRVHSHDDHKLKGLSGSCIFAYEFYPIISGSLDQDQSKRPEAQQTLSDIQRGTVSCKSKTSAFL